MSTGAPVWITRAQPGAEATAARVAALGFSPIIDPLLAVEPIETNLDLSGVSALAFTSVNGVDAFARLSADRALPVFAVGRATAKAAERAGFGAVASADGDVAALERLIAQSAAGSVLWAGAQEPAGDLVAGLRARGISARGVAVYQTVARAPSLATCAQLDEGLSVLLHSPRAARELSAILRDPPAGPSRFLCLSEAVASPLSGLVSRGCLVIAPRSDESALLELLRA